MINRIKKSFICADVNDYRIDETLASSYIPQVADVAIFEVLIIGKHTSIQSDTKRNVKLMPGDWIMATFGTRYATDQFEGYVPTTIQEEYHILGAGGTIGTVATVHERFSLIGPTILRLIGYAVNSTGSIINTKKLKADQLHEFSGANASRTKVVLSVGSSMNSGKSTTAAFFVHGLKKKGYKVAFIKLTGTVYTKDCDLAYDMGADVSIDFSDFGFPSTFMCDETELLNLYESLIRKVMPFSPDYVVVEIADGLYQRETKMLLTSTRFMTTVDRVVFSANDSLSAVNGVHILEDWKIIPSCLCGVFTMSPLLIQEVKENVSIPVLTLTEVVETCDETLQKGMRIMI